MTDLQKNHWLPLAEQAINTIYRLAEHPDHICADIIKGLASSVIKAGQSEGTEKCGDDEAEPEQKGMKRC